MQTSAPSSETPADYLVVVGNLKAVQEVCDEQKQEIEGLLAALNEMPDYPVKAEPFPVIPLAAAGLAWCESMRMSGQPGAATLPRNTIDKDGVHWAVSRKGDNLIVVTADRNNFATHNARTAVHREETKLGELVRRRKAHQSNLDSHERVGAPSRQPAHDVATEQIRIILGQIDAEIKAKEEVIRDLRAKGAASVIDTYEFPVSGAFELLMRDQSSVIGDQETW